MAGDDSTNPRGDVLRLTRRQYRDLFSLTKTEAGAALAVSTYEKMGKAWGRTSWMAGGVFIDLARPTGPGSKYETGVIELADRINLRVFKACNRPEIDWAAVPDHRVYEFVLWHEIGHRLDNFLEWDLVMNTAYSELKSFKQWRWAFRRANEVLADRFAWAKLFPGRPLPINPKRSVEYLNELNDHIQKFDADFKRDGLKVRPLPSGPIQYVPIRMMESKRLAGFVGAAPMIEFRGIPDD